MEKNSVKPLYLVALGVFSLAMAGLLTVMHVGAVARQGNNLSAGFSFRTGTPAPAGYVADLKRGGRVIAARAADIAAAAIPWAEKKPAVIKTYAYSGAAADGERSGAAERDPFEEFYSRNYANKRAAPGDSGLGRSFGSRWEGSGGGGAAADAAWEPAPSEGAASGEKPGAAGGEAAAPAPEAAKAQFGGPLGKAPDARPQLQASLPSRFDGRGGGATQAGQPLFGGAMTPGRGGKLSGMPGSGAALPLDGASESARSGAASGYKARMSGGAAAAASASGEKSPPAASGPREASSGRGSGGAGGAGTGSGAASGAKGKTPSKDPAKAPEKQEEPEGEFYAGGAGIDPSFLQSVASEKRSGREAQYLTEEDYEAEPDEALLKAGGIPETRKNMDFPAERSAPGPADPENFSSLSPARKKELKKELHSFLRRFENRYGAAGDVAYTACSDDRQRCSDNGLTEGYLTVVTQKKARLLFGLKYADKKWRPYTIDLQLPASMQPPPPEPDQPAAEDTTPQ